MLASLPRVLAPLKNISSFLTPTEFPPKAYALVKSLNVSIVKMKKSEYRPISLLKLEITASS